MRHKEIVAFKMHASIKFAADFALGLVTEKLRSRIKFFTSMDTVKAIDRSLLPLEYGGTIPMAKMIGNNIIFVTKCSVVHRFFHIHRIMEVGNDSQTTDSARQ